MPKGPVFYQPPDTTAEDEARREEEAITASPNLNFADILNGMGGAGFISSEADSADDD